MRAVLAMGLLIALCAIAEPAPAQRARQHVIVRPNQGSVRPNQSVTTPPTGGFRLLGWTPAEPGLGHSCP